MNKRKQILIIDGQGGKMGKQLAEALLEQQLADITVVGTNAIATANMLKAGAVQAATGENAVIVNSRRADIIVGPIGIVMTDALLGEITEAMATAVSRSEAYKVLLPVNRCGHYIVGVGDKSMSALVKEAVETIREALQD